MANSTMRPKQLSDAYAFPGFRPLPTVRGIFGDPKARASPWSDAQKNDRRLLRPGAVGRVRPQHEADARSVLRRYAGVSRVRDSRPRMPGLRQGEARATRLSGGQPLLYPTLFPLRRPALPPGDDQGHRRRTQALRVALTAILSLAIPFGLASSTVVAMAAETSKLGDL